LFSIFMKHFNNFLYTVSFLFDMDHQSAVD